MLGLLLARAGTIERANRLHELYLSLDAERVESGLTAIGVALVHSKLPNADRKSAMERVATACKKHNKHWGTIAVNPKFAQRAYDLGCRMLSFGMDIVMVRRGLEATRATFETMFVKAD